MPTNVPVDDGGDLIVSISVVRRCLIIITTYQLARAANLIYFYFNRSLRPISTSANLSITSSTSNQSHDRSLSIANVARSFSLLSVIVDCRYDFILFKHEKDLSQEAVLTPSVIRGYRENFHTGCIGDFVAVEH